MILTSIQNDKVKMLKKLMADKSYVFFDNPKLMQEAIDAGYEVLYTITKQGTVHKADYGGEIVEVSESIFNIFSTTEHSQGIVGVIKFSNKTPKLPQGNFLVLDGLQDPGNVGTLIRSALGANFLDIYLLDCVKLTNEKLIRSTMGAFFKTRLYQMTANDFVKLFANHAGKIAVCDMNGQNVYNCKFTKNDGIIVGNEGNGVSSQLKQFANLTIKIPMQNGLESLNAGVSGSIVMYQISNQISKGEK